MFTNLKYLLLFLPGLLCCLVDIEAESSILFDTKYVACFSPPSPDSVGRNHCCGFCFYRDRERYITWRHMYTNKLLDFRFRLQAGPSASEPGVRGRSRGCDGSERLSVFGSGSGSGHGAGGEHQRGSFSAPPLWWWVRPLKFLFCCFLDHSFSCSSSRKTRAGWTGPVRLEPERCPHLNRPDRTWNFSSVPLSFRSVHREAKLGRVLVSVRSVKDGSI